MNEIYNEVNSPYVGDYRKEQEKFICSRYDLVLIKNCIQKSSRIILIHIYCRNYDLQCNYLLEHLRTTIFDKLIFFHGEFIQNHEY